MALSTATGSLSTKHGTSALSQKERQPGNNSNNAFIPPATPLIIGDTEYTQQIEVANTFTNRTALDPQRYSDIHTLLLAYPSAFTIKVTFFNRYSKTNTSTYATQSPQGLHPVHYEYTQIDNYELKVINGFEFNYDQDNNRSDFTGEAIIYPGFIPKVDDLFIMNMEDGKLGLCRISNVVRLSMRQASYHKVDYYLFSYMNDRLWKDIQKSVTNKVIFNKEAYFNDQIVLLQHDSYTSLQQAIQIKQDIINYYFKKYYNDLLETILTSEGIYDPYVVEFFQKHIPLTESKKRPFQHIYPLPTYEFSLWAILDDKRYKNLSDCYTDYYVQMYDPSAFHTNLNALYRKNYITLYQDKEHKTPYIFPIDFYKNTLTTISNYDVGHILIQLLINNELKIHNVLNLCNNFRQVSSTLTFYHLPLYIYLLNQVIIRLQKGMSSV